MILNELKTFQKFFAITIKQNSNASRSLLLAVVLCLISSAVQMCLPLIFSMIITQCTAVNSGLLETLLISYGLLWMSAQVIMQLRYLFMSYFAEDAIGALSLTLFRHLHSLSLSFHLNRSSGAVLHAMERAQSGFEMVLWDVMLFLLPVTIELLALFFVITYSYGILYAFIMIAIIGIYIILNLWPMQKMNAAQKNYNTTRASTSSRFMDSLLNVETVKYFSNQTYDLEQCKSGIAQQQKAGILVHRLQSLVSIIQLVFIGSIFTLVTYYSGKEVSTAAQVAQFILINGYFLQFIVPLQHIMFAVQQLRKGLQQIAQAQELLDTKPEITDDSYATVLDARSSEIVFDRVSFWYTPERPILQNVSFTVPAGKTVAIVGPSGAGKSSLIRLLFRFFDVSAGSIRINGTDIRTVTQESLHKVLGVVPQDIVLFNNSLSFNIGYGNVNASDSAIKQVSAQAQLHTLVSQLPDGYNTMVGERGLKLSGGEKQRVGIARVLLKKPSVYIFDEATSALDSNTEYEIQKTIREISFGTTTLIVAHRLSTICHADTILVLDNGTITEQGSHNELLLHNGLYAKLWKEQSKLI